MSKRPSKTQASTAGEKPAAPKRKDQQWDDRLRRVGDANYVTVAWSPLDLPNWPLPTD